MEAILLMGGIGMRFGDATPKQFLEIQGKKIYLHALERLEESGLFSRIILVCPSQWIDRVQAETENVSIVAGGATRQESSYLGLLACREKNYVLIHDAVRPFVSQRILKENIETVQKYSAVDTCIPSPDTIVHSKDGKFITQIPLRSEYLCGQTPQTFSYDLILQAHQKTQRKNCSDDCSLVREMGRDVYIVQGEEENFKITTPSDLQRAEMVFVSSLR